LSERDNELDRLRHLDPHAVGSVHGRYFPELYRYIHYRIGDAAAAEDLTSEVFLRLLEAIHADRGPRENLRGWLIGTAFHLVKDHFRETYRRPMTSLHEQVVSNGPSMDDVLERSEKGRAVRSAMSRLTQEQQHVLALRFGSELSLEQTAAAMGKNANAIKALQFRALASLKRAMEEGRP
jgi:RNA polymerase sigma-70 factor (ECF subfamily)